MSWTVTLDLRSEGEVELAAYLNGEDRRSGPDRCSLQEALRQLEILFACTGSAVFSLAVRAPGGDWSYLSTTRWRSAMYFVTAQYEQAFVGRGGEGGTGVTERPHVSQATPVAMREAARPAFVAESGVVAALPAVAAAEAGPED